MQTELNDLMNKAKELLKDEITRIAFDTWIKNLELVGKEGNTYIIAVTSNVHKDSINSRYYDLIYNK